jgi:cyclase
MHRPRIIPVLLLRGESFVKTTNFRNPKYLGDCHNILKLFNEKFADEIIILDIDATRSNFEPRLHFLKELVDKSFMPITYGGGIKTLSHIREVLRLGIEKVALNTAFFEKPSIVSEASRCFGSQSIVVSIDVKRHWILGTSIYTRCGTKREPGTPVEAAKVAEQLGAGEILLTSIDREGTMSGFDLELVANVTQDLNIPLIASGGARSLGDMTAVIKSGHAAGAAASSIFVYCGPHKAVLISYPCTEEIVSLL